VILVVCEQVLRREVVDMAAFGLYRGENLVARNRMAAVERQYMM
jgi:hypothetical protein